ncbi:MAG: AAA family ATPase [Proteobacteria bacterium]|nr:AAA family ATPase [Pseudomonadota bacterium]
MYYDYYGLKQPPFKITPDTSLFFPGGDRGAILEALIYAIVNGEGIVKLVGEVGSGKTTLCRMLEKELPKNIEVVYLANPSLSPDNILHAIAFELHLKVRPDDSRLKVMNSLQNYLLERHAENKQVVVFVEEAQSMPIATLEEIRLLSNLETAQNKLLQIVIFGQPELDVMISKQEIRQLKERITYSFYLAPLKPDEVKDYINSRLRACGYRSVELFNDTAIKKIAKYSKGLLRRINILADKAMLAGYANNVSTIKAKHVKLAAKETEFISLHNIQVFRWGLAALLIIAFIGVMFFIPKINWTSFDVPSLVKHEADKNNSSLDFNISDDIGDDTLTLLDETEANQNKDNNQSAVAINNTSENYENKPFEEKIVLEEPVQRPDPAEYSEPDWRTLDNVVYIYPEKTEEIVAANKQDDNSQNDLLEIRDLIRSISGRNEDEEALLNQLKILPSEVAINYKSVTEDRTCKLCSTIIYRPLKNDEKL